MATEQPKPDYAAWAEILDYLAAVRSSVNKASSDYESKRRFRTTCMTAQSAVYQAYNRNQISFEEVSKRLAFFDDGMDHAHTNHPPLGSPLWETELLVDHLVKMMWKEIEHLVKSDRPEWIAYKMFDDETLRKLWEAKREANEVW